MRDERFKSGKTRYSPMEPLEALLKEEEHSLASPSILYDPKTAAACDILPYLKHVPYVAAIVSRGVSLDVEPFVAGEDKLEKVVVMSRRFFAEFFAEFAKHDLAKAVRGVEAEYGIDIPTTLLDLYLWQLAGRILNFVETRLPGFVVKTPTLEEDYMLMTKRGASDIDISRHILEAAPNSRMYVRSIIDNARRFYEANRQNFQ